MIRCCSCNNIPIQSVPDFVFDKAFHGAVFSYGAVGFGAVLTHCTVRFCV